MTTSTSTTAQGSSSAGGYLNPTLSVQLGQAMVKAQALGALGSGGPIGDLINFCLQGTVFGNPLIMWNASAKWRDLANNTAQAAVNDITTMTSADLSTWSGQAKDDFVNNWAANYNTTQSSLKGNMASLADGFNNTGYGCVALVAAVMAAAGAGLGAILSLASLAAPPAAVVVIAVTALAAIIAVLAAGANIAYFITANTSFDNARATLAGLVHGKVAQASVAKH